MKPVLFVASALPLILSSAALAETKISTARTTPVATSSAANGARDDVTVEKAGSVKPGASGAAVTVDSANKLRNDGEISIDDKNDAIAVLVRPGFQSSVENAGTIRVAEDYTSKDDDKDGDLDGPFATGSRRYGIRLLEGGTMTGGIANLSGGTITVEGNDSAGILLQSRLQGDLTNAGTVSVTGDRSTGISAASVSGAVRVTGAVAATGEGATAIHLGDVGGALHIQSAITATGYRSIDRGTDAARAKLDADDLKQGGPAVRLTGSIGGGILLDKPPADTKADDADEDKDGTPDANEGTAVVTSYGAAPALDIGSTTAATTIRRVSATGDNAYGIVNKGQIRAAGVYDGVAATAIRIGQANGGATTIEGGINVAGGSVTASAFSASATAIHLNSDARADKLRNSGTVEAGVSSEGAHGATAVLIGSGATMRTVRNSGTIAATVAGEKGDAGAVIDRSGTLGLVENTGKITARITPTDDANDKDDADSDAGNEVVTGRAVALDLSANTSGAVVRQSRASSTADAPSIVGDVAFGSGADRFELLGGTYSGALSFGAGADTFIVDGGAVSSGRISDSDGRLAIDVRKGTLAVANGTPLALSSLSIGAEGRLAIAIDPTAASGTRFDVAGAAVIASGAKVEIGLTSLVRGSREFEILRAGSLTLGNATTTLAGAPFLYTSSLRQSAGGNALLVAIRPKTTAELGLNRSGAQAFGAVFDRLDRDKRIEAAFLSARTNAEFTGLYNQLLPEHAGASLLSAAAISSALSTAASQPVRAAVGEGGDTGIWLQEIIVNTKHDAVDTTGFRAKSFGVAGGVERVRGDHAFGIAATFASTTYKDRFAAADESVHMQTAQAALYWRMASGRLKADARVGAGHVWFDSDRKLVSEAHGLDLSASAKWTGWLADAHAAASYDLGTGWLVARPELGLDFIYLKEKGYRETGGGAGFDLAVDARSSDLLRGTAALVLGARFGEAVRWGPEVRAGVRHRLSGNAATTRGRFVSGGSDFALSPEDVPDTEKLVQLAFRTESDGMSFAIEGGTAFDSSYDQYDLRAVIRFAF